MESDRINSNVTNTEEAIKQTLAKWVASHREYLNNNDLRLLANVISSDFTSLPDVDPLHPLQSSGICKECVRRGITDKEFPDSFKKWGKKILDKRCEPLPEYDQAPIVPEQAFLNIAYFLSIISDESSFAFIGDDDFHSLLLSKLLPKLSITVFEADTRVASAITEIAERESLNIIVVKADMRDGIPLNYHGQFDAFYSDPPYSESGILLFLYWGLTLLSSQHASWGVIAVPFTSLPLKVREMLLVVQGYLIKNGFLIEDIIPFFKQSPHPLGIISGIMKCQRIHVQSIILPPETGKIYEHFYGPSSDK